MSFLIKLTGRCNSSPEQRHSPLEKQQEKKQSAYFFAKITAIIMGICPTLDFQRNFPLTQLLNIRAFFPHRETAFFNPHFLGNWMGNEFFMAENGAGSSTGSSLCPLNMKLVPVFPVGCQMQTWVLLIAPLPPRTKCQKGSHKAELLRKLFPAEQHSHLYLGWREASPTCEGYSSQLRNTLCRRLNYWGALMIEVKCPSPNESKHSNNPLPMEFAGCRWWRWPHRELPPHSRAGLYQLETWMYCPLMNAAFCSLSVPPLPRTGARWGIWVIF